MDSWTPLLVRGRTNNHTALGPSICAQPNELHIFIGINNTLVTVRFMFAVVWSVLVFSLFSVFSSFFFLNQYFFSSVFSSFSPLPHSPIPSLLWRDQQHRKVIQYMVWNRKLIEMFIAFSLCNYRFSKIRSKYIEITLLFNSTTEDDFFWWWF